MQKPSSIVTTIVAAARQAGVGVETIRFYQRRGLVRQPGKPAASGARHYPPETVARIRFIRQAQQLGFTLRQIGELLALRAAPDADCAEVRAAAEAKLAEVARKMAQLREMRAALRTLLAVCPGGGGLEACSIMGALTHPFRPTPSANGGTDADYDFPDRRHALRRLRRDRQGVT
ncbi:MAG: MerR family DNA-binding protein [Rhodospirillales bacterium]|nr:MerR family DNA-binding protein [Rhodospirillales bacterium]